MSTARAQPSGHSVPLTVIATKSGCIVLYCMFYVPADCMLMDVKCGLYIYPSTPTRAWQIETGGSACETLIFPRNFRPYRVSNLSSTRESTTCAKWCTKTRTQRRSVRRPRYGGLRQSYRVSRLMYSGSDPILELAYTETQGAPKSIYMHIYIIYILYTIYICMHVYVYYIYMHVYIYINNM